MRIMGIHTTGPAVKNHISSEMARELIAKYRIVYHLWFLVYHRVLLQLHIHLLLHHLHHRIPYLMSTDTPKIQDALHESTETGNKKKGESEEVQCDTSHELPDWVQEFRENLVDESTSTEPWRKPRARKSGSQDTSRSSHELPMEPRATVEPGSHSVYTHFPKDPNCDICLKTKITRASCRRRAGTVVPRAEHLW